jgi:hypothetical protein
MLNCLVGDWICSDGAIAPTGGNDNPFPAGLEGRMCTQHLLGVFSVSGCVLDAEYGKLMRASPRFHEEAHVPVEQVDEQNAK